MKSLESVAKQRSKGLTGSHAGRRRTRKVQGHKGRATTTARGSCAQLASESVECMFVCL